MPTLDGFETAALIRQRPKSHKVPIIFVTAYDQTETHLSRGYSLGAVDYIHAPVQPEILLAKASVFVELARQTVLIRREAERLEQRVKERTAELQAVNQALQAEIVERERVAQDRSRLLQEAQQGVRRRDEFLAMLAHELRNPLASIVNGIDLMRVCGMADPDSEQARDIIGRQAQHMSHLLQDLFDVSRITKGKISLQPKTIDIVQAVRESVETRHGELSMDGIGVSISLPDEPIDVNADPTRLQQILSNLLSNAAKYTPSGGRIEISIARDGENVVIRVRDTGIGIAGDKLTEIFEPFVQLKQSHSRPSEGLGIGLTLVKRLVELHGGKVAAASDGPDRGSEFTVRLPAHAPSSNRLRNHSNGDGPSNAAERTETPLRIVVIDDNDDIRRTLSSLLKLRGHDVMLAPDGNQGLAIIDEIQPDFALIDIGLPGLDGYEVARRVRANPKNRELKLIAITGYGHPDDRRRALDAGFDDHLVKPVLQQDLAGIFQRSTEVPA